MNLNLSYIRYVWIYLVRVYLVRYTLVQAEYIYIFSPKSVSRSLYVLNSGVSTKSTLTNVYGRQSRLLTQRSRSQNNAGKQLNEGA